ncbi:hypothetical protein OG698_40510 [Streptomyces sp. NBC_01003]|uniref:hypothetical protein n=1 Tax=Streptomyces sp. NBC_01003 TaxID=2903714 RepID=UPI00386A8C8A|nr:hypothetical protein OG698_40510 [Streptomyces sp. NBC_01003]
MASPSSRRIRAAVLATSIVVVAAGGVGIWKWTRPDGSDAVTCSALLNDTRIHNALGSAYRKNLSCHGLGEALREAGTGDKPGIHSKVQAQAMRNTLQATSDALTKSKQKSIAGPLRLPLAALITDYAPDTYEILKELDADYLTHASDDEPWEDNSGVHMTVAHEDLVRVVRAISDSPTAYAKVRSAEGRYAAHTLAAIPGTAKGFSLSLPPTGNALVLGALDGVAADVTNGLSKRESARWNKDMVDSLVSSTTANIPDYKSNPAEYINNTWAKGLSTTSTNSSKVFHEQGLHYMNIWAKERGESSKPSARQSEDCLDSQFRKYQETVEFLKTH